ncbi:hypothetical protein QYE76_043710 [Lolium multiflorum]|uniref:Retrotransposon gag domain-containing protein n=1 Tax=Lolium multiflorum TaxID=4521 RepID=A0AAD8WVT2_LOLMU|nr:hypothetical protein QYE76_043710 [Lolium multiflorum]
MGKPRDTKIAILPSTTRKGTTLSTSAALDSPSVISKLVSPPQASNAGTSTESENSSHNCDDASAVLDNDGSLGSFLDATIAKSRQIENTETPNENAATPVNSPESVEYSSDDLDEDYVELDDDFIEKCNATTDARKIKKLLAEHAVRYKLSPDPKFATSPINIRDKDYDFSLDLSHIAIVEKTPFCGTEKESAVEHMTELSTLSGLFSDDIKMRTYFVAKFFPFSLKDDAKTWYNNLPPGSIKSPKELLDVFFRKYFPASAQHAALQRIYNFDQEDGEKLPEAWARFCSLIRAQPDHDLEKHDLLDIFYSGLTIESRAYLDSCAGCVFRKRTPDDAEELLAKIGRNHDDWSTPEPTPTPIVKKRGMIKLNDEDMREAKKSLKEKGIKPEDVKNLPPIEDLCEITPPSSMIEDPLYPEGHPKRVEQDSQLTKTSAPSKKKKKKHKNVVESSEPVNDPNSISISDAETESGNEHEEDNDKNDTPDKEEIEKEPEKHAKNKKYTKEDFITEKHGAVIDCNKGMVTFNVDDKEHTVYFPKRIDKKRKMKKFKFGELFKKGTTSTGRPSRASTQIRRSYNEDVIAPSFAPEEDNGAPNASSFPCYDFLTNAGILDDFFTLVNRAGLATYVGDEREQYYMLTKIFVESFKFHNTQYEPTVAFKIYDIPVTMELEEFCRALDIAPVGSFLDATIAKSRQIENTETPNENAATPVNSPESVEYSSDDLDEDYVELDDDFIEKCNATTDARKIKKLLAEHAVRYKLSPDPKFATSPINIRDKDYDFSLDLSHIAIVEKTPFCGTEKESAVEHMTELSTLSGLFSDDIKMRTYFVAKIFPFSLKDDAKTWYNNLPPGSIKSPKELLDVFFRKYFPASAQHAALQRIYNFDQEDGEKLPEAWARFCSLIRAQPDHDLEKHDLLDIFYSGLTIESRAYLDSCAGCVFRKRTPDDAEELLAKIGRNHDDWSTPEPTPTPIVKKRGMIKLNDEDMREAKKSLKEKGIKPEDVKNLPPIEDLCEITPPSSMIEDFEFHRSQTNPMVRYKIYNKTIDLPFSDFCTAIRVPRWGSCEKIRGTPRELSNLYTRICNGRSFSNDSG